ncbi:MAG: 50S ribosomal protein L18 [Thermoprotei archaeon]|nr:MAG: 50S ribosomal protein L18 [Thermoprotei archaeon]RLE82722.1 MAG: 50S ribosomal protein L18 [Thermoprotei archaeon]RLF03572.1 MAG: 50S ribosomal protein L18 [Thermoprotei archaeon]
MGRRGRFKLPLKRRRKGLTNYYKRRKLILSGKPRLVIRKTNRYIIAQIIEALPGGDKVLVAAHSSELMSKYGWKGDTNNTPAAYLTGYLVGLKALKNGVKEAVADIGLHRPIPRSRIFAVLKGAVDAGLHVPHGDGIFPDDSRIRGEHIAEYAKRIKQEDPVKYEKLFSCYIKRGFTPENLPQHFDDVLSKIRESFS